MTFFLLFNEKKKKKRSFKMTVNVKNKLKSNELLFSFFPLIIYLFFYKKKEEIIIR